MNYAMMTANKKALDELNKIVNPPKNQKKMKIPPRVGSPRCHLKAGFLKNIKDNWEALFWGLCLFFMYVHSPKKGHGIRKNTPNKVWQSLTKNMLLRN